VLVFQPLRASLASGERRGCPLAGAALGPRSPLSAVIRDQLPGPVGRAPGYSPFSDLLRGEAVAAAIGSAQTGADRSSTTVTLRAPLLAHGVGFWCCVPGYPGQCGPDGSPAPQLSGDRSSRGLRREDSQGRSTNLLSPDLQRSTTLERVKKRPKQRDPILSIRHQRGAHRADDSTVEAVLVTPKGPTADPWFAR